MPTLDANLGTKAQAASTTASLVTSAPAAPGSLIVVGVGHFHSSGTISVTTTAGLTWASTVETASGSIRVQLFYAYAAAGLASGSTITWTHSVGNGDWLIGAISLLGAESTPTVLGTNGSVVTGTTWSTGSIVSGEVNLAVSAVFEDGSGTATYTSTGPLTELIDFNNAGQVEALTLSYDLANAATATLAGTVSPSVTNVARGATFKIAAVSDISVPPQPLLMTLNSFMSRVPVLLNPWPQIPVVAVAGPDLIVLTEITSAEVVPDVFQSAIGLQGIASAEAVGALKLQDLITLAGITSAEALSAVKLLDLITLVGIASAENVPALKMPDQVILSGIASAENVPAVTLLSTDLISLTGIVSGEAFIALTLKDLIALAGIASGESLSPLRLTDQITLGGIITGENVPATFQSAIGLQGIPSAENVPGLTLTDPNAGASPDQGLAMKGVGQ